MTEYSIKTCIWLEKKFRNLKLYRPQRFSRYDPGRTLKYTLSSIDGSSNVEVKLLIRKFVGGGFAGQVYQVELLTIDGQIDDFENLIIGNLYALKILVPPSGFSTFFRNLIYRLGFQGPFQPQVNPSAARAGAIWQKLIRKAAVKFFDDENCVVDIYGLFIDHNIGSCGEISEWIEGRTWWLEVDDHVNLISKWKRYKLDRDYSGSPEYRAKYTFMHKFVQLLHRIGAPEFARQYEWSTLKSQPNCLKRRSPDDPPESGLVAVDFRAGLALLPYLPMSPGDFKLIIKGLLRGSLVQFDRGNIRKLSSYFAQEFPDDNEVSDLLRKLQECEQIYRNSTLDLTHNHFRIFYSSKLWATILNSSRISWKLRNLIDEHTLRKLGKSPASAFIFNLIASIPFLGRFFLKLLGMENWRKHYLTSLIKPDYLKKNLLGLCYEKLIKWHRGGRIDQNKTRMISNSMIRFTVHLLLSILPTGLHRFLSDKTYFKDRMFQIFIRPLKLYFDNQLRKEWFLDMIEEGKKKHMLSDEDAEIIQERMNEPFIQKYLKSLAVHICTIPITQLVSIALAFIYVLSHPEMPRAQAWGIGVGIIALFQVIPISPGSFVRGIYVVFLIIKERNFRDYNIAVFLSFFKYIGYLAFPIQMTYKYPALARFMAGHWATEAVHIIPIFGERGALMEHAVFNLFYNWPITIRRQMTERKHRRNTQASQFWHIPLIILLTNTLLYILDLYWIERSGSPPLVTTVWWITMILLFLSGSAITRFARGLVLQKRFFFSLLSGLFIGISYMIISYLLNFQENIAIELAWRCFIFGIFSTLGCLLTEISLGEN